jgi:hypothetical protein
VEKAIRKQVAIRALWVHRASFPQLGNRQHLLLDSEIKPGMEVNPSDQEKEGADGGGRQNKDANCRKTLSLSTWGAS